MNPGFVHLHLHSEYSLADSTIRLRELVAACARMHMPAVAVTDINNLFALVKFYRAAEKAGIKPIAGCDLWLPDPTEGAAPQRLTVLCQDRTGYLNLSRLLTRAYAGREGQHVLVEAGWLRAAAEGLFLLAGQDSGLGRLLLAAEADAAAHEAGLWQQAFPDRFYLEATRVGRQGEDAFLAGALELAGALDLPVLASNDVRFLERDDFDAHEARVCIHAGRVLADPRRPRDYTPEQYLKSPADMLETFADLPELCENTVELARRCNLELSFGTYHLPDFPVPAGETLDSQIRRQAAEGLAGHLDTHGLAAGHTLEDYQARLEVELGVIIQMGFAGYFLIVADFIGWAKENDIPVGPGRGSGAGSLVAWSLGITDLDPLRYGLLFERFLNPERVSMPDFDIDFCMDQRDRVIDYVARKYGRERVSQIITYGTMAARAVLRDAGRVLGMPYGQVDRIAKLLPRMPLDLTLADALGRSERAQRDSDRIVSEFRDLYEEDEEVTELVDLALKLENLTRNAGKHAGGVVIAPQPLSEFVPLFAEAGSEGLVTQFDKDDVESVGLVKFDFLGLRTLTIIDWTVKAINARKPAGEPPLDLAKVPLDDPAVFRLLQQARTVAVFQLESRGMQGMLKDARPDCFEDIIALVSLYRPGPMDLIPSFCARKQGQEPIEYPDPRVEPVLRETYGIMVYQEQVMQMAQIVGGYSLGGADLLRRAMGKKQPEEMARERVRFRDGAAANGLTADKADAIFDLMEKFAGYGFNKSHAAAYALVSYQTAWLKAHYPAEFMAAVLSSDMENTDKVVNFLSEARALELTVLPPHINESGWRFEATADGTLRYGLGAIKGVGHAAVESLVRARESDGAFTSISDLCRRIDPSRVGKRVLEALIRAGALDGLCDNRATLMLHLPEAQRAAEQALRDAQSGQGDMFGSATSAPLEPVLPPPVPEWPLAERLVGERDTLGHYLSGHPADAWADMLGAITTCRIGEVDRHYRPGRGGERRSRHAEQQPFILGGTVIAVRKQGEQRAFVTVEDGSGRFEAVLYREAWYEYGPLLTRDALLVFEGGLAPDDFSGGWQMRVQTVTSGETLYTERARQLTLRLGDIDPALVARLREQLAPHAGGSVPVQVLLESRLGSARFDFGPRWRLRASPELAPALEQVEGVLGAHLGFR